MGRFDRYGEGGLQERDTGPVHGRICGRRDRVCRLDECFSGSRRQVFGQLNQGPEAVAGIVQFSGYNMLDGRLHRRQHGFLQLDFLGGNTRSVDKSRLRQVLKKGPDLLYHLSTLIQPDFLFRTQVPVIRLYLKVVVVAFQYTQQVHITLDHAGGYRVSSVGFLLKVGYLRLYVGRGGLDPGGFLFNSQHVPLTGKLVGHLVNVVEYVFGHISESVCLKAVLKDPGLLDRVHDLLCELYQGALLLFELLLQTRLYVLQVFECSQLPAQDDGQVPFPDLSHEGVEALFLVEGIQVGVLLLGQEGVQRQLSPRAVIPDDDLTGRDQSHLTDAHPCLLEAERRFPV